jgi:GntR family transcriptional regulator, transcriptional repressor for pyruvate dehydrogenase complex
MGTVNNGDIVISQIERISSPRKLTSELSKVLRDQILSGQLKPGDKLPTEQELLESAGVSRTVVREAIAALKAERLVISRQGVGVFVCKRLPEQPFLISTDNLDSLDEVVRVLELRLGVEIEAAGLAAERRRSADLKAMQDALALFDREAAAGGTAADPDIAFHMAIARATGNDHFVNLIDYFGRLLFVPGRRILFNYQALVNQRKEADTPVYLDHIRTEHNAIIAAIKDGAPPAARKAMRRHLERAKNEYQTIASKIPAKG